MTREKQKHDQIRKRICRVDVGGYGQECVESTWVCIDVKGRANDARKTKT